MKSKKDKDWYEFRYLNKKRLLLQIGVISAIITASFMSSFIILSAVSKDANIHLYTDLDVEGYDRISLITRRRGEEYYLPLNLEKKSSYFTIPKSSRLEAFEVEKDVVISDDVSEGVSYSYNQSQTFQGNESEYNAEYREGILYNQYVQFNYSIKTQHYDGVYSFFYDENEEEPNGFTIDYGSAVVKEEYDNHKKVLTLLEEMTQNKKLVMTVAQQLKQEGIEECLLKTAKNFLKNGASIDLIKKSTGLSRKQIEELDNKK